MPRVRAAPGAPFPRVSRCPGVRATAPPLRLGRALGAYKHANLAVVLKSFTVRMPLAWSQLSVWENSCPSPVKLIEGRLPPTPRSKNSVVLRTGILAGARSSWS